MDKLLLEKIETILFKLYEENKSKDVRASKPKEDMLNSKHKIGF